MSPTPQERNDSISPSNFATPPASGIISIKAAVEEIKRLLGEDLPTRTLFARYRPPIHWFLRPEEVGGIHGINHEARVMIWQELLARLLMREGIKLDQEALRWAAATHDTRRIADGLDFPHGERAAAWVQQVLEHRLPGRSLETVMYLNRWHVPSDNDAPVITPELAVFKDADGLDRVRLADLNPMFLRWHYSKTLLLSLAQALFEGSEIKRQREGYGLFDCVIEAAVELGFVLAE